MKNNLDFDVITKDKNFLKQKQKFFDLADNIQDEKIKKSIIYQMIKCEETLIDSTKKAFVEKHYFEN